MIGCYFCGVKPKRVCEGGVDPCDKYCWYEVKHEKGCPIRFCQFTSTKKDKKKWYDYNYRRKPKYRFGMTEEQIKNLTPEQEKAVEDFWFPMKRVMYPKFICKDLLTIDPKDPTKLIVTKQPTEEK